MTIHYEGKEYDRVTDILFCYSCLGDIDKSVLKRAADRGTLIHNAADCIIADIPMDDIPDEYTGYINSFKLWMDGKTFLSKPARFYDDELMITGECDGLYQQNDIITLFDLKTPVREGSTWGMQGAAYAYLAKKLGYQIDRVEFIKLSKEGRYPAVYQYPDVIASFLTCLEMYRKYFKNKITDLEDF